MYRYVCPSCGHESEHIKSLSEADNVRCESCGELMTRQIGTVGIVFKGGGYYATDSRKGSSSTSK